MGSVGKMSQTHGKQNLDLELTAENVNPNNMEFTVHEEIT